MILFSHWKKNVVVYKVSSCFNTLWIPPYGDDENVWAWPWVAVWARPSKVRIDALHSKGLSLTSHLPAAGSHLTWGLPVSLGKEWCGYMNHNVANADGEMPLSMNFYFQWLFPAPRMSMLTHDCMLMSLNSSPKEKNIKSEDKHFLTFLSFKVHFFKISFLYYRIRIPWYFSLFLTKQTKNKKQQ